MGLPIVNHCTEGKFRNTAGFLTSTSAIITVPRLWLTILRGSECGTASTADRMKAPTRSRNVESPLYKITSANTLFTQTTGMYVETNTASSASSPTQQMVALMKSTHQGSHIESLTA